MLASSRIQRRRHHARLLCIELRTCVALFQPINGCAAGEEHSLGTLVQGHLQQLQAGRVGSNLCGGAGLGVYARGSCC